VDGGLKNEVAHETKMMVYNSREGYVCPFNINMEEKFENFHHIHD
jgi:anoctamin-10